MALTRKMLQGMGLTEEQVDAIIEEHTTVKADLKEKLDAAEKKSKDYDQLVKDYEDLKKTVEENDGDEWKEKFDAEHKAFEKFKKEIEEGKTKAEIEKAYEKLLKDAKVGERHIKSILGVTDFSNMKLNEDGTLDGADKLTEAITEKWGGFIVEAGTEGAGKKIGNPPPEGGGKYTSKADIMKIADSSARQQAIAENPQLFGR